MYALWEPKNLGIFGFEPTTLGLEKPGQSLSFRPNNELLRHAIAQNGTHVVIAHKKA